MSESTRDQRMTPGLAPVACVDLTVPRATEGGKSAKEGKAIEDKGRARPRRGRTLMSSGFYSQNGRWPDPKSSKQKGGAGYFPNYSIFCILLECCC